MSRQPEGRQDGTLCDECGDLSLEQFEAVMRQQIRQYTQVRPLPLLEG